MKAKEEKRRNKEKNAKQCKKEKHEDVTERESLRTSMKRLSGQSLKLVAGIDAMHASC